MQRVYRYKYIMYTIIEDCSPYYIRFTYDNISEIINLVSAIELPDTSHFLHHKLPLHTAAQVLSLLPFNDTFDFIQHRVSLFATPAGYTHFPHKDGLTTRVSINFGIRILDDKCVTNWYSDADINDNFTPTNNLPYNRALVPCPVFNKNKQVPIKSMTAVQGECVLLNTDLYHDFDNSQSVNSRVILTLRLCNHHHHLFFNDVKSILFNSQVDTITNTLSNTKALC